MSYEGYCEYLCRKGHYQVRDAYDGKPDACAFCGEPMAYSCSVDCTNGEDPEIPASIPGDKREIGIEDDWTTDHHGNRYARAVHLYKPTGNRWHHIKAQP